VAQPTGFQTTMVGGFDGSGLTALSVESAAIPNLNVRVRSAGNVASVAGPADASANVALYTTAYLEQFDGALWQRGRVPGVWKDVSAVAVVAGVGFTAWTPGAGKKFRLMGYALSSSAAAAIIFGDNAVGTVLHRTPLLAAAGVFASPPMGNGQLSAAANNVLKIDVSVNSTLTGFLFGTEE
jgi:hypothetical protein